VGTLSLWTRHELALEELRRAIPGGPEGWMPERLIFRDFWHWRDHELGFAHGRLALTGQNGAGKSSLLALCLPTLLDGDASGTRLDPAQSRDRRLEWYLLGDEDADPEDPAAFAYTARTGYVALEFRHGTTGQHLTIGMGVSAARNHPRRIREWWGLVVPDRRLGRDWEVRGPDGQCLGLRDLARSLPQPPALVTPDRDAYRRRVNEALFGMTDDDYRALIAMLLQARRPKLGEQAGPEQMCRLLRDALPGVPEDKLERLAEVVQNIEDYQRQLEDLVRRAEVVAELDRRLGDLAEALARQAAHAWRQADGRHRAVAEQLARARAGLARAERQLSELEAQARARAVRLREVEGALEALRERPEADLPGQLAELEARLAEATARLRELEDQQGRVRAQLRGHEAALQELAGRFRRGTERAARAWRELARRAAAAGWADGARALEDLAGTWAALSLEQAAASPPPTELPALAAQARGLARACREVAARRQALEEARALARERGAELARWLQARSEATDRRTQADQAVERARAAVARALADLAAERAELSPPLEAVAAVALAVQDLQAVPPGGPGPLLAPLRAAAEGRRRELEEERRQALEAAGRASVRLEALTEELARLQALGPEPERSALRRAARRALGPDGPRPLFRWVRFRDGVDEETRARVEAAALEAGLLDLLVAGPEGGGDAWLAEEPGPPLPPGRASLAEVLVPEEGAPEAVARLLATVGWGEGPGERWLAPDGRWRHGAAAGRVVPWLAEAPGLVGAERRRLAAERLRRGLEEARAAAERELERARGRAAAAEAAAAELERDLRAFEEAVPWQDLFGALERRQEAEQALEQVAARAEQARGPYEQALGAVRAAEAAWAEAVALWPPARELDGEGLRARAAELEHLAERLQRAEGEDALGCARDHRERDRLRREAAEELEALAARRQRDEAALAELGARVQALRERLQAPDVAELRRRLRALEAERQELLAAEERERPLRDRTREAVSGGRKEVELLEPRERELAEEAERYARTLRERLAGHERLTPQAALLEAQGPAAAAAELPEPPDEPEADLQARRTAVQQWLFPHQDLLGDYRPRPLGGGDGLAFQVDRQELSAAELGRRLWAEAEQKRQLIAEEERRLYERIMYQGILDELRRLLARAREFTRRTNAKLAALRLSSGERLALRLVPCDAQEVPGAAVGALLEELDQGTEWLSAERREVLLRCIQQEVQRVRDRAREEGDRLGWADAIRLALDYRRWYTFELTSQLPGAAQPSVVRSRGFGRRSGSAKAWALAVPVLAGVAARYDAARPDAPRLVGLDEAFAGLDPNNQANYLQFLADLGLAWILTCPDELPYGPGLSAAMAYRLSLSGGVHLAEPLLWDGRRVIPAVGEAADP
jgi:hypothetical protein